MPRDPLEASVYANSTKKSATDPLVIKHFWPFTTYTSSLRTALVLMERRSEPADGSVAARAVSRRESPSRRGRYFSFKASLPP